VGKGGIEATAKLIARELAILTGDAEPKPEPIRPMDDAQRERAVENFISHSLQRSERYAARLLAVREASRAVTEIHGEIQLTCMACGSEMVGRRSTKTTCSARCRKKLSRMAATNKSKADEGRD